MNGAEKGKPMVVGTETELSSLLIQKAAAAWFVSGVVHKILLSLSPSEQTIKADTVSTG